MPPATPMRWRQQMKGRENRRSQRRGNAAKGRVRKEAWQCAAAAACRQRLPLSPPWLLMAPHDGTGAKRLALHCSEVRGGCKLRAGLASTRSSSCCLPTEAATFHSSCCSPAISHIEDCQSPPLTDDLRGEMTCRTAAGAVSGQIHSVAARYSLLPAGCLLLPAGCLLLPAPCSLLPARCFLLSSSLPSSLPPSSLLLFSFSSLIQSVSSQKQPIYSEHVRTVLTAKNRVSQQIRTNEILSRDSQRQRWRETDRVNWDMPE